MAAAQGKVIITCAVTGSIHTPSMSPYLPITPEEIAEAALGAARAGAAIVHLHARNPKDGSPTQDPELFRQFGTRIRAARDVVLHFTTGGAPTMSIEERLQPALKLKPEVASLNMGSMNFGLYEMLGRYKEFKHDWEKPYCRVRRAHFQERSGTSPTSCSRAPTTTRASRSSATTSGTSTPRHISSSGGSSSRRSSSSRCSASAAASDRTPRTCCT
jgi:uncharacterized protein (DUF849 family)